MTFPPPLAWTRQTSRPRRWSLIVLLIALPLYIVVAVNFTDWLRARYEGMTVLAEFLDKGLAQLGRQVTGLAHIGLVAHGRDRHGGAGFADAAGDDQLAHLVANGRRKQPPSHPRSGETIRLGKGAQNNGIAGVNQIKKRRLTSRCSSACGARTLTA